MGLRISIFFTILGVAIVCGMGCRERGLIGEFNKDLHALTADRAKDTVQKRTMTDQHRKSQEATARSEQAFPAMATLDQSGNPMVQWAMTLTPEMQATDMMQLTSLRKDGSARMRGVPAESSMYIDITLPNEEDRPVSLSSYVGPGKYVLLDFWASWCPPCMQEIPYLVAAYKKYHDKGFEIFGVSLDTDGQAWRNTIRKRQMNWVNVSSLAGWDEPARYAYGVTGIPANFLIGPDGRIIARGLRGSALETVLAKLLK